MMSWVPISDHAWVDRNEAATLGRYADLAFTISEVTLSEPPVTEDHPSTALLLASVGAFESAYRADIMTCAKSGRGHAWGPFQYQGDKRRVCASLEQATRFALGMVRESFEVCHKLEVRDRLGFYTDGRCVKRWYRSRSRIDAAFKAADSEGHSLLTEGKW